MQSLHEWARFYAARGWPVFPLIPREKKPMFKGWQEAATTDLAQIDAWWKQWPDANIGVPTGRPDTFTVVDLDVGDGKNGPDRWAELTLHNDEGSPLEHNTGGGGVHLLYRHVEGIGNRKGSLAVGVDIRGTGGLIAVAPSIHPNGKPYSWAPGMLDKPLELPPGWLVTMLLSEALPDAPAVQLEGSHTLTREDLEAFIAFKSKYPDAATHVCVARAVLDGTSWGKGARYTRMVEFLGSLRNFILDRHGAPMDAATSAPLFDACTAAATAEGVDVATDRHWIVQLVSSLEGGDGAYRGKLEAARAAKKAVGEQLAARLELPEVPMPSGKTTPAEAANEVEESIQRAFGSSRTEPYTADELALMEPTKKTWVLGTPAGVFLRCPGGDYQGPFDKDLVPTRARDVLAPAYVASPPVFLMKENTKGEMAAKTWQELLREYGTVPATTAYSYVVEKSKLEGDMFVQRTGVARRFAPEFNGQIDQWLKLFAGEQYEAVCDWLATLTRLDSPTSALVIMGVSGAGKDLLIDGVGKIWGGAKLSFTRALDKFNHTLTRSPLVVANEQVRVPSYYVGDAPNALKEMISDTSRLVEAKGKELVTLYGCVRVILATNSDGLLDFDRTPTTSDIEALDERTLLIRPSVDCKNYLKNDLGGRKTTEAWVNGEGIARHVEWLRQNRSVVAGERFLVEGRGGMSDVLSSDSKGSRAVLKALLDALLGPLMERPEVANFWRGDVWVSAAKLKEHWSTYGGKESLPEDPGALFDNICEKGTSKNRTLSNNTQLRMRQIKWPVLLRGAQREGREEELQAGRVASLARGDTE